MLTKLMGISPPALGNKINEIIDKVNGLEDLIVRQLSELNYAVGKLEGRQMAETWAKTYPDCPPEKED